VLGHEYRRRGAAFGLASVPLRHAIGLRPPPPLRRLVAPAGAAPLTERAAMLVLVLVLLLLLLLLLLVLVLMLL